MFYLFVRFDSQSFSQYVQQFTEKDELIIQLKKQYPTDIGVL